MIRKDEFITIMSEYGGVTKKDTKLFTNLFIDTLTELLNTGQAVQFTGFGKFEVVQTKEKKGRNFKTSELLTIPSQRKIKFIAGTGLTKSSNQDI